MRQCLVQCDCLRILCKPIKDYNCPISEKSAFRYGTALTALLDGPQKAKAPKSTSATATTVFWTETPSLWRTVWQISLRAARRRRTKSRTLQKVQQLQRLLEAVRSGTRFKDLGESRYAVPHSGPGTPNAARVSIRFYHRSTVADLLGKLHDHQKAWRWSGSSRGKQQFQT